MKKKCLQCHIKFSKSKNCSRMIWKTRVKTCSMKCKYLYLKQVLNNKKKIVCYVCAKTIIRQVSKIKRVKHSYCSNQCKRLGMIGIRRPDLVSLPQLFKNGHEPWNRGKICEKMLGENNPAWRGGVTPLHNKIRKSIQYRLWRVSVFERDNYTCQLCRKHGGEIHADHIKQFAFYPELRFNIDNGRTLCKPCHKTTPTYGNRNNLII